MKAYSTASGAVMFIPETIDRKTNQVSESTAKKPNTLMAKKPMSYKDLAGTPAPTYVAQSEKLEDMHQQTQAM